MANNIDKNKEKILKLLEENPNLLRASKIAGVARSTIYRWMAIDPDFTEQVELAQEIGRDTLVDFAESKLLENVKNSQQKAIEYFLSHNASRYANNAVHERHAAHRNVGRLAKLPQGMDSVYLYPQTQLIESMAYFKQLTDHAHKLRPLLGSAEGEVFADLEDIDPVMAKLFLTAFPEAKDRIEQQGLDRFNKMIDQMVAERRQLASDDE